MNSTFTNSYIYHGIGFGIGLTKLQDRAVSKQVTVNEIEKQRLSCLRGTTQEPEYAEIAFLVFSAIKHSNPTSFSV